MMMMVRGKLANEHKKKKWIEEKGYKKELRKVHCNCTNKHTRESHSSLFIASTLGVLFSRSILQYQQTG